MNNLYLEGFNQRINAALLNLIETRPCPALHIQEAMHYCLFPGGKRMRPLLIYLCGELFNINLDTLDTLSMAIELMHTYSLVHDDLPAMDNDDYRRGKLSCHRAFDESTAILVGDGLQTLAIDVLLTQLPATVSAEQTIRIAGELTDACGPSGMLSGQGLDLILLSKPGLTEQELTHIHQLKTGRLILACINMVLIASHAPHAEEVALRQFATQFGLLFQMQDDYLDQYDEIAHLGKKRASDLSNQKFTFASFMSKEALFERLSTEFENTLLALRCFEHRAKKLRQFIQNVFMRSHSSTLIDQND